ncbi:MAG TPA: hypothetical protein VHI52_18770, partial [Verrucomicrobiae bacterium]|nr:hypothetical protein [Verrucomicrobiae bacterium]
GFVSQTDARGVTTSIYAQTGTRVDELRRSYTIGGVTTTESLAYTYFSSGSAFGKIQQITYSRQVGAGSWTDLQQVVYTYYGWTDAQGSPMPTITLSITPAPRWPPRKSRRSARAA